MIIYFFIFFFLIFFVDYFWNVKIIFFFWTRRWYIYENCQFI
jgi:hypothetical protein